ncbi:MAG: protein TolR [Sulfuricellaceae bacterium]|jgi:biopolymer transport protein TolR
MRLRKSRRFMNHINVVPYIDVMLVLLIIFMVTAPLISPGQIELPQVGQSLGQPIAPLQVDIRADNSLSLRDLGKSVGEKAVTHEQLLTAVKAHQQHNPNQAVVISADKNVRYDEVVKVMTLLQENRVAKVGLLVRPKAN